MMVKPSSKQLKINKTDASMENHNTNNLKEEPHLSGAYIRSLVKHLTSIKPKDPSNGDNKPPESVNSNGECITDHKNMQQHSPASLSPSPPSPPVKKQIRRRRHTTKPYQERLLNMAEARREIVTALKFHRASMKQKETAGNWYPEPDQSSTIIATTVTTTTTTSTLDLSGNYYEYHSRLSCSPPVSCYWSTGRTGAPSLLLPNHENLDLTLPNQTLGLNLNFQDFINLNANLYHNPISNFHTSSSSSSLSSSTSSSAAISFSTEEIAGEVSEEVVATSATTSSCLSSSSGGATMNGDLHHAMDDEEMEEIRSLGEQHQMEWNDTVNLLTSARWFKYLKSIEIEQENRKFIFDEEINPFDRVIEFPTWMYLGEIEGMDGEWLA